MHLDVPVVMKHDAHAREWQDLRMRAVALQLQAVDGITGFHHGAEQLAAAQVWVVGRKFGSRIRDDQPSHQARHFPRGEGIGGAETGLGRKRVKQLEERVATKRLAP